jgi:hypothetical protein
VWSPSLSPPARGTTYSCSVSCAHFPALRFAVGGRPPHPPRRPSAANPGGVLASAGFLAMEGRTTFSHLRMRPWAANPRGSAALLRGSEPWGRGDPHARGRGLRPRGRGALSAFRSDGRVGRTVCLGMGDGDGRGVRPGGAAGIPGIRQNPDRFVPVCPAKNRYTPETPGEQARGSGMRVICAATLCGSARKCVFCADTLRPGDLRHDCRRRRLSAEAP